MLAQLLKKIVLQGLKVFATAEEQPAAGGQEPEGFAAFPIPPLAGEGRPALKLSAGGAEGLAQIVLPELGALVVQLHGQNEISRPWEAPPRPHKVSEARRSSSNGRTREAEAALVSNSREEATQPENRFKARSRKSRLVCRARIFLTLAKLVSSARRAPPAKCQVAARLSPLAAWAQGAEAGPMRQINHYRKLLRERIKERY